MSENLHSLDDWLSYIALSHPSEIELGLDRVKSVYQRMDFKDRPKKVVLVAGTNGKGSTIALSQAGLSSLGIRCGAYTSPHISKYNERVQLLGDDVSDETLISAFKYIEAIRQDTPLTYFEFGTLAAIYILFNANLDVALLEIGLGGRLDAVNILDADVSVITSVDIDHVDWLGDDINRIGFEKAGILRSGQLFLAGEQLPGSVFEQAEFLGCRLYECRKDFSLKDGACFLSDEQGKRLRITSFPDLALPENNILLAMQLVYFLSPAGRFDSDKVCDSMANLKVPGRLEPHKYFSYVYFDVGHNPHAARFLAKFLLNAKSQGKYIEAVFSALGDKDIRGVVRELASCIDHWLLAPLFVDRAVTIEELRNTVSDFSNNFDCFESIDQAMEQALGKSKAQTGTSTTGKSKLVLVFGSFFTVEAAKKYLERYE